ncbi:MAG TPA: hypothetical protein PLQ00_10525, partial [Thermoguttaceae bacterium]|nr:hypothetical protein [Thermoguttaceae bacterium]
MRSIYSISVWGLAIVLTVAAASARAGMITFEPPTYTAGYSFLNVDGWTYKYGWDPNDKFLITPISGGELRVLSGTQSAVLYQGTDRAVLGRQFDAGTPLLPFDI